MSDSQAPLFSIPDFQKFQHYRNRRPPWIKLYGAILDDYEFGQLSDAAAAMLPRLWCVVAEDSLDGCYHGASNALAWRLRWSVEKTEATLQELGKTKFLTLASDMLATRYQDASNMLCQSRERVEREREGETEKIIVDASASTSRKVNGFHKPTIEEVRDYISSQGYTVNAEAWIDHYTANGWRVGKNPMKDWRAAVRTWARNERPSSRYVDDLEAV